MSTKQRPNWDIFWFAQALIYSTRGTCDRLRTGCVIVKNKRIVGAGYNGSVSGLPHCDDVGHHIIEGHCERTLHGEENAVLNTARNDLKEATAYVIATPCYRCAKILVNAGVSEVKYLGSYSNSRGKDWLESLSKDCGVPFTHFDSSPLEILNIHVERLKSKGGALYANKK